MELPVVGNNSSRPGITPVVSIVLLLMMTVALAGAAYNWFNEIQSSTQDQAANQLRTAIEVRDLECVKDPSGDKLVIGLKNTGERNIKGTSVDIYVYDSDGGLYSAITDKNWATGATWQLSSPTGKGFLQAGGYGKVVVDMPATDQFVADNFYTVNVDFTDSEVSKTLGGCIAG